MTPALRLPLVRAALILAGGAFLTAATWAAFRHGVEPGEPGLPVLGKVPEFSLVSSTGAPLSQADLSGEVWIADFIFTQCPGLCPLLSSQMARMQDALKREGHTTVRLVSFTVDPSNDTPDVLRAYAAHLRADPDRWMFVTGEHDALHALISDGFHLAVAERAASDNTDGEGLITHSDRFVLVDRDLKIRGYYHGTDADALTHLMGDVATLAAESGQRSVIGEQVRTD